MASGRYFVLGTAGHIDHGKTTLVKALTGTDCDRFAEEKERGITIDIGFAELALPDGTRLGVVDVPGHRRFIRNMAAGASGIDLLLLVVAADDGVMPQTREHLAIARLLGVRHGLIALTKTDMVDGEITELAVEDVRELTAGTFLDGCPVVPVSAVSGAGLDALTAELAALAGQLSRSRSQEYFRLAIDRSFSIHGSGTVVTGTSVSGSVRAGDELEVMPAGRSVRVRGLQVHGAEVTEAGAGYRLALNLAGIDKDELTRGDVLVTPGSLAATRLMDASLELLADPYRPLKSGSEALLYIGTQEIAVRVYPLDDAVVRPGSSALVQLRSGEELALAAGDRFILRDSAMEHTIGGGEVLDAHPTVHRRQRQAAARQLAALQGAELDAALLHEVAKAPWYLSLADAALLLHTPLETLRAALESEALAELGLMQHPGGSQVLLSAPANRTRIAERAVEALGTFHQAHPLTQRGLAPAELSKSIDRHGTGIPAVVLVAALDEAVADKQLERIGETYSLPGRTLKLGKRDNETLAMLRKALNASAQPEQPEELLPLLPVDKKRLKMLLDFMDEQGEITSHSGMYFGMDLIRRLKQQLRGALKPGGGLSVSQFGKLAGSTRKYSLPLLQWFERDGFLKRDGDLRVPGPGWEETGG